MGARAWLVIACCAGCRLGFDATPDGPDAHDAPPDIAPLSVQGGFFDLTIGASSGTVLITPIDPAISVLTFSLEVSGTGADDVRIGGSLESDRIQFKRGGTGELVRIRWYVTTWSGMTVRRGLATLVANELEVIAAFSPPIDPAHSFVLADVYGNDGGFNEEDLVRAQLVTGSMLRFTAETRNGTNAFIDWQVVEIPTASVQHGLLPMAAGESDRSISLQPFDLTRSLLVYTQSAAPTGVGVPSHWFVRGAPDAANNLRFDRVSGVGAQTISWSLIEIEGARVQHGSAAFGPSDTEVRIPIDAVDPAAAVPFGGGFAGTSGRTNYETDTSPSTAWGTLDLLGPQELVIKRRGVGASADLPWSVIDMP